ncbi:MAG: AEC family transporter, partial [Pirellulales bacterium]|nr:AEC family transporter [Pirellulales bacterium]
MDLFTDILTTVTLPIVALLALGWLIQQRLNFDVATLSRLLINVVLPCALFHFLTTADLPLIDVWPTAWFTFLQFVALTAVGWSIAALLGVAKDIQPVIGIATGFANTGNFGIPVAQLAFPPDYLLHQTVMVSLHSILIVPVGVLILAGNRGSLGQALWALFTSPMILAVAAG